MFSVERKGTKGERSAVVRMCTVPTGNEADCGRFWKADGGGRSILQSSALAVEYVLYYVAKAGPSKFTRSNARNLPETHHSLQEHEFHRLAMHPSRPSHTVQT
jgi:hypothetical protein